MTEILFIRHAFTLANNSHWNNQEGIRDFVKEDSNCPIDNYYGKKQAEELNIFLKEYLKNKKVLWYMSPYYRVLQTSIIASNNIDNIEFKVKDDLREINAGLAYGRNEEELNIELKKHNLQILDYKIISNSYPLGESELDVKKRVKKFADEVIKINDYDIIIIFSHETVNKWLYYWLKGKDLGFKQKTTEVISLEKNIIYTSSTLVPKGYLANLEEYNMEDIYINKQNILGKLLNK